MKRRGLTPEEQQMWSHVTRGDTPLPPSLRALAEPPAPPRRAVVRDSIARDYDQWLSALPKEMDSLPLSCGAYAGIDRNTADRFRKGEYPVDATLDLHGMTREKAHRALSVFLRSQHERGSRCLLVVTGKGQKPQGNDRQSGVLRDMLPQWLAEPGMRPAVLAFDVAKPKHGGSGAYYILLRRRR